MTEINPFLHDMTSTDQQCARCAGLLVSIILYDVEAFLENYEESQQCVNCGNIQDPVVLWNRIAPKQQKAKVRRKGPTLPGA